MFLINLLTNTNNKFHLYIHFILDHQNINYSIIKHFLNIKEDHKDM